MGDRKKDEGGIQVTLEKQQNAVVIKHEWIENIEESKGGSFISQSYSSHDSFQDQSNVVNQHSNKKDIADILSQMKEEYDKSNPNPRDKDGGICVTMEK